MSLIFPLLVCLCLPTQNHCQASFEYDQERIREKMLINFFTARIQFRLPSNEMPSWEFPDKSTLQDVRLYLMDKVKLNSGFKLVRTYPRTALTPEDECKTLSELNLTPSSTLIVVPVSNHFLINFPLTILS